MKNLLITKNVYENRFLNETKKNMKTLLITKNV